MNLNGKNLLLLLAGLLIFIGLIKPDLSDLGLFPNRPAVIDLLELAAPTDENVKKEAEDVVSLLKSSGGSKSDFKKLRDLTLDLGRLVELDGDDLVIKNTEEIRQANSLAGPMLRLDIKGKYPDLAKEAKEVIVASIGDDNINLSTELRTKAVAGFNALAWAYNEASK
ncbi:MAG: hypothetical protein EBZ62_00230 [Sphingobacteriia bacterium]|nr:hypothetical protein [Sphingobacteriia bacterium]